MTNQWRRANQAEQAQGFEAVNIVEESIHLGNGAKRSYLRQYYYKHAALERRAKRGDSLPEWYENKANVLEVEFLDYVLGAEPSDGVRQKLIEMGRVA